jgi:hypothetical protein
LGWQVFLDESTYPVLVCVWVAGELQDRLYDQVESTMNATPFDSENIQGDAILFGRVWPIRKRMARRGAVIEIGRTAESDVTTPEYSRGGKMWVLDYGSKNGTRVRGVKLFAAEAV